MRKKVLFIIIFIISIILISSITCFAGDDYPSRYKNQELDAVVDDWNFYNRECTSFVAWRLNSRNGVTFTNQYKGASAWGDAKTWGIVAKSLGITVNNTPVVGSVAWWNTGDNGHVAWVEAVNGSNVTIEEYNVPARSGKYNRRTVSASSVTGFIHIKDLVEKPTNLSISTNERFYSENETVNFTISANNVSKYVIEMFCNGENLGNKNASGNFSYFPQRTGVYRVRVVGSNSAGTTYSDWIEFTVGIGSRNVAGDFNGDGRDDYASLFDLGNGRSQWHVFLSTGSSFSEEIWWTQNIEGWYATACNSGRIAAGDFNGDGLDDIAVMYGYDKYDTAVHVFLSTGTNFQPWSEWKDLRGGYESLLVIDRIASGDFNGDGLDDIAVMYGYSKYDTSIHVLLSTGTSFDGWWQWYKDYSYESGRATGRFVAGDFNGDGLDDIAAMFEYDLYNSCIHVFLSTGTSFQNWQSWFFNEGSYASKNITGRFTSGDFNGDGLDDVAAMYNYGSFIRIHVWTSAGTVFNTLTNFAEETQFNPLCVSGRFLAGDFNGDGLDDVATMYDYSSDHAIFHMYISEKDKFRHEWWNYIDKYDVKRTSNMKGYGDNYLPAFIFKKIEIPPLNLKVFTIKDNKITNTSNDKKTATVIIAQYNNKVLHDTEIQTITFDANETRTFAVNGEYKIFVWDSLAGMHSLCELETVSVQ